jgi:UDP-N-acetylglucosamine--N-acetylmuramyl-(pentapeptide) pyrophosphoryl-undecaprenol N-acetylglucosamine transferase
MNMKYIISGGGTGGHIFPAIAIANGLRLAEPNCEILFVGAEGKMEMEKVPQAGYKIEGLPIAGFKRGELVANLTLPFKILGSLYRAYQILKDFKPDAVVGVGGYASGPVLKIANFMRIPTFIQEQNSYAGVTNKLLSKQARNIFVAYSGMEKFFPKEKIVVTGNPVRQDLVDLQLKKKEGLAYYGLDSNKKTIVLMGGSLGARTMNEAVEFATELLRQHPEVQILWQIGKLYMSKFSNSEAAKLPNVHPFEFLLRMDYAYAVADLVVARAGALTISEVCIAAVPVILVPSPHVTDDHQTKNAESLSSVGAAILLRDAAAKEDLIQTSLHLLADQHRIDALRTEIHKLAKPSATHDIVQIILNKEHA